MMGVAQLMAEEPRENSKGRDSPWGSHFVPISAEVTEALLRGMGKGWGKGKDSAVISDALGRLTRPLPTQFSPAWNSTGRKQVNKSLLSGISMLSRNYADRRKY